MPVSLDPKTTLPRDGLTGTLVGRVWRPDVQGPSVVVLRQDGVFDVTKAFPTMRDLCETRSPAATVQATQGERIGSFEDILANTPEHSRNNAKPWFLAPNDLQAVKAAGVTFAISLLERVIEEQARGAPEGAAAARQEVENALGGKVEGLKPGSPEAMELKKLLQAKGLWSQYLEVGIGPDAEIFTKAQPMSAVGTGASIGILPISTWNNPEPEIVLVVTSHGEIVGVTLGNDVNLRDIEGRSALLLGKCKDNNASAAVGPFIRLFDATFSLDDVRASTVTLSVTGTDGFVLEGESHMSKISRDPVELVEGMMGSHHQYPDGAVLYLGTMFAPIKDRDAKGQGFTHHLGDVVTIASEKLGSLTNVVTTCEQAPHWTFGSGALMRNLARRGLLTGA
ncbi:fumarylacetoacetate FAA hydrolase family protein [Variibacter gotjawalensis]|uniref:Fumarylacetoacetate FAA hydrolase family protein n=1 Tax=Variibacter gotjawalensis TaxID=1333996 RepID=A0A0S3PSW4_9BRAD|nr:fumarylacetoacetate hydrolase family protein [Variibacter gotjawalensis]NIK49239.1 fumarylacetoacetate (FAA) hydrolase family protein [Variibacter gotjawalensis]RZS51091.1 fumarylacetoacetate (FAA) hydrolase family protein [Variibacter gotjawalensis]BAT58926.1 fumarylacetoacetate FAA hydrolase family protein [Variibacter gotjawalensis]